MTIFVIKVEKALDWQSAYLSSKNSVVEFQYCQEFDSKEEAADAASIFNMTYGRNGRIYAEVEKISK